MTRLNFRRNMLMEFKHMGKYTYIKLFSNRAEGDHIIRISKVPLFARGKNEVKLHMLTTTYTYCNVPIKLSLKIPNLDCIIIVLLILPIYQCTSRTGYWWEKGICNLDRGNTWASFIYGPSGYMELPHLRQEKLKAKT